MSRVGYINSVMTRIRVMLQLALAIVTATRSAETLALFIAERLSPKWIFLYITVTTVQNHDLVPIIVTVAPCAFALAFQGG